MAKKRPASTIGRDAWSQFEAAFVPEDLPPWERAMCRFSFFHGIETAIKFAQVLNGQKYEADRARVLRSIMKEAKAEAVAFLSDEIQAMIDAGELVLPKGTKP